MKQVLQDRNGLTVVRDVPPPQCGRGSLLVRNLFSVISSGTERSRVETSQKSLVGKARARPDLVQEVVTRARQEGIVSTAQAVRQKLAEETAVGYSSAGTVLEVGADVRGFSVGDLVACAGEGHASHAEIVNVPANLAAKVPPGVPAETAAMATIAAIPLHAIRLAGTTIGDTVAVIGCGLVGDIACRLLHAAGAATIAIDVDPARVERAVANGSSEGFVAQPDPSDAVLRATGGRGVDQVLITAAAPSHEPLLLAAAIARDRGTLVLVGDVPVQLPRSVLYDKELSFRVSRSYGPGRYDREYEERGLDYPVGYVRWTEKRNMECVLELQASGRLALDDLVELVPVEDAPAAYKRLVGSPQQRPRGALVLSYPAETPDAPQAKRSTANHVGVPEDAAVRIGLIGPGNFARRVLVPALKAAGARLEAVGGGTGPSAEAAGRQLGFARVLDDPAAIIDDPVVNAVVIATRHGSHAALATQALRAGKHVLCEKPLALDADELDEVLEAARSSEGILAVGFNRRFAPLLVEAEQFVAQRHTPIAASYRVSAGPLPAEHWTHDSLQGGGRLIGEGCHFIDALAFLAASTVKEVHATGYGDPQLPIQAHDNACITLTFADGSVGSIVYVADGARRLPKERLEVFSGRRSAVLDDYRRLDLYGPDGHRRKRSPRQDKGHRAEVLAFVQAAHTGKPPAPLASIENVSRASLCAVESLRTGRVVTVPA